MQTEPTSNIQLVLNAQSYSQCIDQARELVSEYDNAPSRKAALAKVAAGKTGKGKVQAAAEVEDDLTLEAEETTDELESFDDLGAEPEEVVAAKPAAGKGKKLTEKDVNAQAMAYAKVHGRQKTLALLTKKFKKPIKSILELKPEQYALAIQTLAV